MSLVHHFLRAIWANVIGLFYELYYWIFFRTDVLYLSHKQTWDNIKTLDELNNFFRNIYKYKYDGPKGIIDHNNFKHEFLTKFGDCDDVARYACKKLKTIFGKNIQSCYVYGFFDLSAMFWHYDCVFKLKNNSSYLLYNYGNIQDCGSDIDNIGKTMCDVYESRYTFKNMKFWKCYWM